MKENAEVIVEEVYEEEYDYEEEFEDEGVIAVHELMPLRAAGEDSMERIADMKDQFSRTIDPILRMYNAAMCATKARL